MGDIGVKHRKLKYRNVTANLKRNTELQQNQTHTHIYTTAHVNMVKKETKFQHKNNIGGRNEK